MGDSERRIAARHRVTFGAVCDDGEVMRSGRVLDLSLTGAFLHTDTPLPIGAEFVLFPLDEAADELFEIRARVVRHVAAADITQAPGVGVNFLEVGPTQRRAIKRMMAALPRTSSRSLTQMPVMRDVDPRLDAVDENGPNPAWARIGIRMFASRRAG